MSPASERISDIFLTLCGCADHGTCRLTEQPWPVIAFMQSYVQDARTVSNDGVMELMFRNDIDELQAAAPLKRMYTTIASAEFILMLLMRVPVPQQEFLLRTSEEGWRMGFESIRPVVLRQAVRPRIHRIFKLVDKCLSYSFLDLRDIHTHPV